MIRCWVLNTCEICEGVFGTDNITKQICPDCIRKIKGMMKCFIHDDKEEVIQ